MDNQFPPIRVLSITSRGNRCSISPPKRFYLRRWSGNGLPSPRSTETPIFNASRVGPPEGGPQRSSVLYFVAISGIPLSRLQSGGMEIQPTLELQATQATAPELHCSPDGVEWLTAAAWSDQDWLWHGFSTRRGGVSLVYLPESNSGSGELNLGFTAADSRENVQENRLRFAGAITGKRETPLRAVRQIHSNRSVTAPAIVEDAAPEADGIMTNRPGQLLSIQTADCIPVLVADPIRRAVAAFHAGWRGTVERIVELGVQQVVREFGSDPQQMIAAIGPGIGSCCYAVGGEVEARFEDGFSYAGELFHTRNDALYLNLIEANRRQLLTAGLAPGAISMVGGCTSCQPDLFFSHRASGGHAGRMMAVAGIR